MLSRVLSMMLLLVAVASCGGDRNVPSSSGNDVLAQVGDRVFTRAQLAEVLPAGLSSDDSLRFSRVYLRRWIDNELINDIASGELVDMTEIDAMVEQYRRNLIMMEYRKRMTDINAPIKVPDDSLALLYEQYKDNVRLESPLVKGVLVTVPDDFPSLTKVRNAVRRLSADDVDFLEKLSLGDDVTYDYFMDEWADGDMMVRRVTADSNTDASAYLARHRFGELKSGNEVTFLAVKEFLPSGAVMPLEKARPLLEEIYMNAHRLQYDAYLMDNLYKEAVKKGQVKLNTD